MDSKGVICPLFWRGLGGLSSLRFGSLLIVSGLPGWMGAMSIKMISSFLQTPRNDIGRFSDRIFRMKPTRLDRVVF